jgi:hypothetical protein
MRSVLWCIWESKWHWTSALHALCHLCDRTGCITNITCHYAISMDGSTQASPTSVQLSTYRAQSVAKTLVCRLQKRSSHRCTPAPSTHQSRSIILLPQEANQVTHLQRTVCASCFKHPAYHVTLASNFAACTTMAATAAGVTISVSRCWQSKCAQTDV